MNLLAFDTSTETLRIAVQAGSAPAVAREAAGGALASTTLIPAIMDMLAEAGLALRGLDAIVFGRGPGSFTGLRTACSVAQGLAFGADIPVLPVETLLAVAEDARMGAGAERVVAVLDARMDEVYTGSYEWTGKRWDRSGPIVLAKPEAVIVRAGWSLAGNAFSAYGARLPGAPGVRRIEAVPSALALLRLAPVLIAAGHAGAAVHATPLYVRDKVAQTTQERATLRAAQQPKP
jgi:tRNA threonylcarbamoyladenosine biosynthesis protein TsaB